MIFMVAALLPQMTYAQAVLNNGELTITTTQVGQVSGYVSGLTSEQKASVTSIVLIGKFGKYNNYQDDLEPLGYNHGFTAVTTVDMSEAKFVTSVDGYTNNYRLFESAASGAASFGTHAIVGGTLYVSAYNQSRVWNASGTPYNESARVLSSTSDVQSTDNVGDFGKIATIDKYLQMSSSGLSWSPSAANPQSVPSGYTNIDLSSNIENRTDWENYLDGILSDYSVGTVIKLLYHFVWDESNHVWVRATITDYNTAKSQHDEYGTDIQGIDLAKLLNGADNNNPGGVGAFPVIVYYTKSASTLAWTNETTTAPEGYDSANDATFDYAFRDSHKDGYADGTWVKMTDYNYYQLANGSSSWGWNLVNYSDGQDQYVNVRYADETAKDADYSWPNNANQYALVGGTEYIYDDTAWKLPSEVTEFPNYADMKFSYWQETLTTAITSKYANETISNEIFQNCKKLTYVDYKAGNVIGFNDHKINAGYNTNDNTTLLGTGLSVNIGKNVSSINSDAFLRCDVLTSLTFDTDYGSSNPDMLTGVTYPINLDIGNGAFQDCFNLPSVIFPNRVRSIGNDAFKQAGNNVERFTVEFERRFAEHDSDVSIDYDVDLTIGSNAFAYCHKLDSISLPIRLVSMGNGIFQNSGLEHFVIREDVEDSRLTVIPSDAFLASHLLEIVIPRSVTEIMGGAFSNCPSIRTVTFQESLQNPQPTLYLHDGAFSGGNEQDQVLTDVYVNIDPNKRLIICEYNAFNFTSMVGQTSSHQAMAKLHFPEEFWDYYQGAWKRGIAFTQDMLSNIKDGYSVPEKGYMGKSNGSIDTTTGMYEYVGDGVYTPTNGWHQFARSYTNIDIDLPLGLFLRSYSTPVPLAIPVFPTDGGNTYHHYAGDPMFKVYRITNFDDGATEAAESPGVGVNPMATATEIALHVGDDPSKPFYIPANTGVILVGYIDPSYLVYLSIIENAAETAAVTYPFNETIGSDATNLLYPTCIDSQRPEGTDTYKDGAPKVIKDAVNGETCVQLNSTIPCPYTTNATHPLQYRLFGLSSSLEGSFNRLKNGVKMSRDKAYLKLNKDLFHYSNEGANASGSGVPIGTSSAPILMSFVNVDGETTDVRMVDPVTMTFVDDCYYTLQGVRMNVRPTQAGIYIHNGKKIVIK